MLGKRSRPASDACRPPEPIAVEARVADAMAQSPASPLERDPRSPKGWKNRESAGVGLGIVAALEKSGSGGDIAAKAVMGSPRFGTASPRRVGGVSCEGCCTGVFDGAVHKRSARGRGLFFGVDEDDDGWGMRWDESAGSFRSSSPFPRAVAEEVRFFPTADFLSSCYLCQKKLHGGDIYMYRGEKAFCSTECRYRQIVIDEYQENCASQVSKPPSDVPMSDYSGRRLFYTGIAAA